MIGRLSLLATALMAAAALPTTGRAIAAGEESPKNVILYVVDDLGFQLGCYGDALVNSPNLDRLAAEGTRFTRAFCTTASCSASRSVILSGQQNHANGQYGHQHGYNHFSSFDSVKSLPVVLAEGGYRTCSIGKYHVAPEEVYHFEQYANQGIQGARNSVRMAENARQYIEEKDDRPFFLYICTSDPHRGGGPGQFGNPTESRSYEGITSVEYKPDEVPVPSWLPGIPETRRELAEYYQAVSRIDQGIGRLMEVLKETGHWNDTLILFLSDNGPAFAGAKTTLYEPGMNLPLIVRHPQQDKRGVVTGAMVTWADLMPTILDYTGIAPPKGHALHGRSFLGVLEQENPQGWSEVYASHTFHEITMYYPMRVIRTDRYKYILNLAHPLPYPFASDLHASLTWQGVLRRGLDHYGKRTVDAYLHRPRHELYDLQNDPHEIDNLADNPDYGSVLAELQAKLKAWQKSTRDPWIVKYEYE